MFEAVKVSISPISIIALPPPELKNQKDKHSNEKDSNQRPPFTGAKPYHTDNMTDNKSINASRTSLPNGFDHQRFCDKRFCDMRAL